MKYYVDLNLNQNELQNAVLQNLASHPVNPKPGQKYYNTTDQTEYLWNGTEWINAAGDYIFQNGVEEVEGSRNVQLKLNTSGSSGLQTFTADSDGLKINVNEASTTTKGLIEIATDAEASTGSSEVLAVNPKQLATKQNLVASATDNDIATLDATGQTKDSGKSFTTSVAAASTASNDKISTEKAVRTELDKKQDLVTSAVENNITTWNASGQTKDSGKAFVTTVGPATGTGAATDNDIATSKAVRTELDKKQDLVASATANDIAFLNSSGQVIDSGKSVTTSVAVAATASDAKIPTEKAIRSAIDSAIAGGIHYAGTWTISTSTTDYSGIILPQSKGALFYVTGTGPATVDGVEWNPGDYLLVNDDVAAGGSLAGKVEKIDNTEAADIVRLDATQTLTNKTIDADDNTIQDLTTSNFKSGVVVTSIGPASGTGAATDTEIATAKAIRSSLDGKQDLVTAAVENNIATWNASGQTKDSGKSVTTTIATSSTSDNKLPTEQAVRTELNKKQDLVSSATNGDIATLDANGQVTDSSKSFVTSIGPSSGTGASTDAQVPTAKAVATLVETTVSGNKIVLNSPALTASSGICTWSISGLAGDPYSIVITDASGNEITADITYATKAATVKFNSSSNIAANTFKARILM